MYPQKKGHVLLFQIIGLFLIAAFFLHSTHVAQGLLNKQKSQLDADLVALSAARIEAEILQFIGVMNHVMKIEARIMLAALLAPVVAALTVAGLPAVPSLVRIALKVVPRIAKALIFLSRLQKLLVNFYPFLVTVTIWRVGKANGFSGAIPIKIPRLPVTTQTNKFIVDMIDFFEDKPIGQWNPSGDLLKKALTQDDPEVSPQKTKDPTLDKEIESSWGSWKDLKRSLSPHRIFAAHYLDERWLEDQIDVVCWNDQGHIRVASAQVVHNALPRQAETLDHSKNNYITLKEEKPDQGFDVELTAFPDYLEALPALKKMLEKTEALLKKSPIDLPLKTEHLKWIQH